MQMPHVSRGRALAYLVVVLVLLVVGGKLLLGRSPSRAPAAAVPGRLETLEAEPAPPRPVVVYIVGAVRRPGLYELEEGSRVDDVLRRAGGAKPKAALELVNLAAPLADGQQVVIPARVERAQTPTGVEVPPGTPAAAGPVHLSTATLEELDTLPGVGPVTAQKILDYRGKHGSFRSVDELDAVPGIGPARLEQLRELVAP